MIRPRRRHSLLTTQFRRWQARRYGHWARGVASIRRVGGAQVYVPGPSIPDRHPMTVRPRLRIRDRYSGQEVVL